MTDQEDSPQLKKLREMGADIERLRNSDEWKAWLRTAAKFHKYSFMNTVLIWCQKPDATRVAGYRKWQELGRQVRKGEKRISILAPMSKKEMKGDELRNMIYGFRTVGVFDISQTDGDPLPEVEWPVTDEGPEDLWAELQMLMPQEISLRVIDGERMSPRGSRGYLQREQKELVVVKGSSPSMASTLLHELAHWYDPDLEADATIYAPTRADCELVAESTAWLVGQQLGLDTHAETEHYLASWKGSTADLLRLGQRITTTTNRLRKQVVMEQREEAA